MEGINVRTLHDSIRFVKSKTNKSPHNSPIFRVALYVSIANPARRTILLYSSGPSCGNEIAGILGSSLVENAKKPSQPPALSVSL